MNKCLVTTLKAQTNNEALSKYNVLTIKIKASDSPTMNTQWFDIGATSAGDVEINSNTVGLFISGISGGVMSYPVIAYAGNYIDSHFENKDGVIEITNKYNVSRILLGHNASVRIKEIYGLPATIENLIVRNIEEKYIDVTRLCNSINISKVTEITLPIVNYVNKLSKDVVNSFVNIESANNSFCSLFDNIGLNDLSNFTNIKILECTYLNEGELSSLAKWTNLIRITFSSSHLNSGDIMDFINPWIQAGRTSGKIQIYHLLTQRNITLNGSPISYPSGVSNGNAYLNWTSDGTVTFTAS